MSGKEIAHDYPVRFSTEHLIKAVAKLTGRTEERARKNLADLYEANEGGVFGTLVDYLAASFLGALSMCRRRCIYRGASGRCDYHLVTGRSRVAQVYETLGVKKMTDEARKLLSPKYCPFFAEGRPKGKRKPIALPGSRPREKQPRTAHNKGKYSFDSAAALRHYQQGCNDPQIADAVGTKSSNIAWWRKVNGLPANWKQGRTK